MRSARVSFCTTMVYRNRLVRVQLEILLVADKSICTGSMDNDCLVERSTISNSGKQHPAVVIPLAGSTPHAFLMDCTHDNESPLSKRTAQDALSTGALVAIATSAVGSNRGFDDLYPKLLDVVSEERHYETYADATAEGLGQLKRILNHLHTEASIDGFVEGHFHQENDFIISHRVNPITHQGYLVVARTAFSATSAPAFCTSSSDSLSHPYSSFLIK